MKRTSPSQAGFTLIEVMVVVAVVGALAAVALPSFAGTSRKAKGDSEVNAFFAELRVRQEQYHLEYGFYMSTGSSEDDIFPASPSPQGTQIGTLPATWSALRVRPPASVARCGYVVVAGSPTDSPGAMATSTFNYVKPEQNWFYIIARCNLDGNSATDSYYFISSDGSAIQKVNPGR